VFALGGTIAMTADQRGGAAPTLSAEQLVSSVPGLADLPVDLAVVNFRQLPGAALGSDDLVTLSNAAGAQDPLHRRRDLPAPIGS
jgi:L-asparaginase